MQLLRFSKFGFVKNPKITKNIRLVIIAWNSIKQTKVQNFNSASKKKSVMDAVSHFILYNKKSTGLITIAFLPVKA